MNSILLQAKCVEHPPGDEIYRKGLNICIWSRWQEKQGKMVTSEKGMEMYFH